MGARMTLVLKNLSAGYDRHPAVHHVSGVFEDGSLTALIGPNGGGKSTLLKALMGFVRPMTGSIERDGLAAEAIAYLPQHSAVDRSFPISVLDVVLLGHWRQTGAFRAVTAAQRTAAQAALEKVDMAAFAQRPVAALSSGQWQRVLFARLMVQNARVVLLDEPFAAIDARTTHDLMHHLEHWHKEGRTVIAVMHDLPLVRDHFPQALMLAREVIAWGKTSDVLRDENLATAMRLATSWHDHAAECGR